MLKSFKKNCKRKERKILSWKKNSDRSRSQWVQNFKGITSCVRGAARGGPMSPVWILKCLVSVFINACRLLSALPSLSQFGWGRLSLVKISFYTLSQGGALVRCFGLGDRRLLGGGCLLDWERERLFKEIRTLKGTSTFFWNLCNVLALNFCLVYFFQFSKRRNNNQGKNSHASFQPVKSWFLHHH